MTEAGGSWDSNPEVSLRTRWDSNRCRVEDLNLNQRPRSWNRTRCPKETDTKHPSPQVSPPWGYPPIRHGRAARPCKRVFHTRSDPRHRSVYAPQSSRSAELTLCCDPTSLVPALTRRLASRRLTATGTPEQTGTATTTTHDR